MCPVDVAALFMYSETTLTNGVNIGLRQQNSCLRHAQIQLRYSLFLGVHCLGLV